MRIAFLLKGLTGYQEVCYRALSELGDELLLVYPSAMDGAPFDDSTFGEYAERHVWAVDSPTLQDGFPRASELVPLVDRFRPDVVLMSSWQGKGYRAVMASQRGRALRVLSTSNIWQASARQWVGRFTKRWYIAPFFDCAFVPGDRSEWFARRLGFSAAQIIRGANSADVALFDRGPRSGEELLGQRRFLFTGRLVQHKRPDLLSAAYRAYRASNDDPWGLCVAGEGPLAPLFDGIPGVEMRGFVQPSELSDEMQQSSCFILPSDIDWYGVVVHEAAAAGLPLLVADGVGAVPHLLQDGYNGWTVASGDEASLVSGMRRMAALDPGRIQAMSDGSRSLARRLDPQIWARNFHEETELRLKV